MVSCVHEISANITDLHDISMSSVPVPFHFLPMLWRSKIKRWWESLKNIMNMPKFLSAPVKLLALTLYASSHVTRFSFDVYSKLNISQISSKEIVEKVWKLFQFNLHSLSFHVRGGL